MFLTFFPITHVSHRRSDRIARKSSKRKILFLFRTFNIFCVSNLKIKNVAFVDVLFRPDPPPALSSAVVHICIGPKLFMFSAYIIKRTASVRHKTVFYVLCGLFVKLQSRPFRDSSQFIDFHIKEFKSRVIHQSRPTKRVPKIECDIWIVF